MYRSYFEYVYNRFYNQIFQRYEFLRGVLASVKALYQGFSGL